MGRRNRELKSEKILAAHNTGREWKAAIYTRLSNENNGLEDERSLQNQIDYLRDYVKKHPNLNLIDEYVDNGHTGTNFKRPEFIRLLEDIKTDRINCVIVKDLSRFGRNYLETGYYIEKIFPFFNTRFIAVNDHFDSMDEGTKDAIVVPIKNLVNEMYSRDISKKIISTLRMKENRGEAWYGDAPYGYYRDQDNPFHLIVDEDVEPYVNMIFCWAKMGFNYTQIASRLNEIGAETPWTYKVRKGTFHVKKTPKNSGVWAPTTVKEIENNPFYTGATVYNRSQRSMHENIAAHDNEKEEWYVIPDTHQAYISKEDFENLYEMNMQKKRNSIRNSDSNKEIRKKRPDVLDGLFYCADCGKKMYYYREIKNGRLRFCDYYCSSSRRNYPTTCKRVPISDRLIRTIVLDQIRLQLQAACKIAELKKQLQKDGLSLDRKKDLNTEIENLKGQMAAISGKRSRLYSDFAEGTLTEEDYLDIKREYDGQFKECSIKLLSAEKELAEIEKQVNPGSQLDELVKRLGGTEKLTYELAHAFVKKIEMSQKGQVQITFLHNDWMQELAEMEAEK